ncbi:hypothetical protein DFS34DRAFT_575813 [Phlyctochytrium arcticum]|nr:hypothetical protein DFS34DRAFT_575813 [Phlyctochytrium arcticum]
MRRVPVVFFWEVKRQRTAPYWKHPSLRVIHDDEEDSDDDDDDDDEGGPGDVEGVAEAGGCALDAEDPADGEDDDEETSDWEQEELEDGDPNDCHQTFEEEMTEICKVLSEFGRGLEFQVQFRDYRMLQALKREGATFLRMARGALQKENRLRGTRGRNATTWELSSNGVMFYRARPPVIDENT